MLANGSGWLPSEDLQEISIGIVNDLVGRSPRDDGNIHRIVLAIYLPMLAVAIGQLLALWLIRN